MNRIYSVVDQDNQVVRSHSRKNIAFYTTLGSAKAGIKQYIEWVNKKRPKGEKLHYDNFEIVESELVEKERHKL